MQTADQTTRLITGHAMQLRRALGKAVTALTEANSLLNLLDDDYEATPGGHTAEQLSIYMTPRMREQASEAAGLAQTVCANL